MKRTKANGEGSIRHRSDGRWEGRIVVGHDENGKMIQKNVVRRTKIECIDALEELKRQYKNYGGITATMLEYEKATVGDWLDYWYVNYSKPFIKPRTAEFYENFINNHLIPYLGDITLKKLQTIQIQKMINDLKESGNARDEGEGLASKTVRGIFQVLNLALKQAVKEHVIPYNPCDGCALPKKDQKEMKYIPSNQIGAYLKASEQQGELPMFYLELSSGLRLGELVALEWKDLDLYSNTLRVNKTAARIKGELVVTTPKTQNSIRTVKLPQDTVDLLVEEHKKHPDNVLMFPSPVNGGLRDPHATSKLNKKILKRAGLDESVRFHDLRHTYATMALENGVDVKTLSENLGHYEPTFTLMTYAHVSNKMQNDAALKVGSALRNAITE